MTNERIFQALEELIDKSKNYKFSLYYATFRGKIICFKNKSEYKWAYKRKGDLVNSIKWYLNAIIPDAELYKMSDEELNRFVTIHELKNEDNI